MPSIRNDKLVCKKLHLQSHLWYEDFSLRQVKQLCTYFLLTMSVKRIFAKKIYCKRTFTMNWSCGVQYRPVFYEDCLIFKIAIICRIPGEINSEGA